VLKRQNRRVYLVAFLDDNSRFLVGYGLHASQSSALVLEVRPTESDVRGAGRIGADFWPVVKGRRGRRPSSLSARFPESGWRNLDIRMTLLAPGKEGAIATTRYEMFREGLQECETRLLIEEALFRKKVSGDLAERCQAVLAGCARVLKELRGADKRGVTYEQRDEIFEKFVAANWQRLTGRLYAAAAEVDAKLKDR
jgi:hypothetical protein